MIATAFHRGRVAAWRHFKLGALAPKPPAASPTPPGPPPPATPPVSPAPPIAANAAKASVLG